MELNKGNFQFIAFFLDGVVIKKSNNHDKLQFPIQKALKVAYTQFQAIGQFVRCNKNLHAAFIKVFICDFLFIFADVCKTNSK